MCRSEDEGGGFVGVEMETLGRRLRRGVMFTGEFQDSGVGDDVPALGDDD